MRVASVRLSVALHPHRLLPAPHSPVPIAYSVRSYPASNLILVHLSGTIDGDQLEAALIAQARAMKTTGTRGVWNLLGVRRLDLAPNAFEHLIHSFSRVVRLWRPGAQAIVTKDIVSHSLAHLIRRRAQRFEIRVEVAPTVDAACQMLHRSLPESPDVGVIRAASAGAS